MRRSETPSATPPGPRRAPGWPCFVFFSAVACLIAVLCVPARAAEDAAAVEKRLADSARYLASDELEGRGPGTKGIDLAADYIARQFAEAGLKTELFDGAPMQQFSLRASAEIGPDNKLRLVGPPGTNGNGPVSFDLKPGEEFAPMAAGAAVKFDLPLVFVGYGITAEAEGYDDYAGVDVAGKAVIVLRHEPQRADPKSVFNGTRDSDYAPLQRKLANAREHGAAAVIFCTDQFEIRRNVERRRRQWQRALDRLADRHAEFKKVDDPTLEQIETQRQQIDRLVRQIETFSERLRADHDPILSVRAAGGGDSQREVPVVHCRRPALDRAVKAAVGTDLAKLEEQIDQGPKPHSRELTGWRVAGQTDVELRQADAKNVVAVLEGEGPLAEETIVVGAHYDHLGKRGAGSVLGRIVRSMLSMKTEETVIYNGADDNASGVAALIEIARVMANRPEKLRRRVVFIAFAGEELGLLGSRYYVRNPLIPLEQTVAMLNLDMVGRLRDERLSVAGSGTGTGFGELLDRINQRHDLKLNKTARGFGASDHMSFHAQKIPVMFFSTGPHPELHRPSDDFETLNISGMRRVTQFAAEVLVALANAEDRPEYADAAAPQRRQRAPRPFLGTIADSAAAGSGCVLRDVFPGGPAQRAGLRKGDVIIQLGDSKIGGLRDIDAALRQHKAGDRVRVEVRRGEESLSLEVTLDPPR